MEDGPETGNGGRGDQLDVSIIGNHTIVVWVVLFLWCGADQTGGQTKQNNARALSQGPQNTRVARGDRVTEARPRRGPQHAEVSVIDNT